MTPRRCTASFPRHLASETYEYWDGQRICARHLLALIGPQLTLADGYAPAGWCRSGHLSLRVWAFGDNGLICGSHLREAMRIATWPYPPETLA